MNIIYRLRIIRHSFKSTSLFKNFNKISDLVDLKRRMIIHDYMYVMEKAIAEYMYFRT